MKRAWLVLLLTSICAVEACKVPAWVNTAEQDAQVAVPIAASLIDVIDPALAPVVAEIEKGFTALVNTLKAFQSAPTATNLQAVQAAFQAVDTNVAQLEAAAQIKNPATQATVTSVVHLLAQAVTEIGALVPVNINSQFNVQNSKSAGPAAPLHVHGQAKGWKAEDFKKAFDAIADHDSRLKKL